MTHLHWRVAQIWAQLEPVSASSVLALAAAALLHWGITLPGEARLTSERAVQEQARSLAQLAQDDVARRDAGSVALAKVAARLPPANAASLNTLLEQMQKAAEAQHLAVDTGAYQLTAAASVGITRYSVSLPLKASYPSVRGFIRQVLDESPYLALDAVTLSRTARTSPVIEARLEFSAYFRRP
jgi:hypothetical protein